MELVLILVSFLIGTCTAIGFVMIFQKEKVIDGTKHFQKYAIDFQNFEKEKRQWKKKLELVNQEIDELKNSVTQLINERGVLELAWQKQDVELVSTKRVNADEAIVFGRGKEWLYLYTFPTQENLAHERRSKIFPMKLGMSTQESVVNRIDQQVSGNSTAMSEKALVRLVFRVNNSRDLETWMHRQLKKNTRQVEDSIGVEWFNTNPIEIEQLFRSYVLQKTRVSVNVIDEQEEFQIL